MRYRTHAGLPMLWRALAAAAFAITASSANVYAAAPAQVNFTLEGCRNNGDITLPNIGGEFICPDAAYTTGNLGKGWNELDLVPYRITASAGNSAPASQTYTVAVVLDNKDAGRPGYDVLSVPMLNLAKSSASCSPAAVGAETIASPGIGGIDESRFRLVTITQAKNTECVYDYYGRLALGSHLFPGSSLHANLTNEALGTAGIGARDVSIPVKEISPQELRKDMAARQDANHTWNLTKSGPASVSFGDVCEPDAPKPQAVTFRVEWTRLAATPGTISATTNIYAKNPAARTIRVTVSDTIYQGTTQTVALDTKASAPVDVPANTERLVFTHTAVLPVTAGNVGDYLNDVATATYTDLVTGIPVPGQTTAIAQAQIVAGNVTNSTAFISDAEIISGTGLSFSVAAPSFGSFLDGYIAGTPTSGEVKWLSTQQSGSNFIEFNKTIYLDTRRIVSGKITDAAALAATDGFATNTGNLEVPISSSASVKLTVQKKIPDFLDPGEKLEVTFHISRLNDPSYSVDKTFLFEGGGAITQSMTLSGLVPDDYTVTETGARFYPAGCNDLACSSVPIGLQPAGGPTQNVNLRVDASGANCSGTAAFENVQLVNAFATAQVQKVTDPVLAPADPDYSWTFTLQGPGLPGGGIVAVAGAGAGYVDFGPPRELTSEGLYTITETTKAGWDLNSAVPNNGVNTKVCSFTVDYPEDYAKIFQCTFKNTKRGKAKVVKTVQGQVPSGTQAFTFQLREGASPTQNGTTLESGAANATNLGTIAFSTLLVPGNTYQLCEVVMPGWQTTLGTFVPNSFNPPDGVAPNPNVDNSIVCIDFTVAPGETKVYTVDNTPPPGGRALTIGFWKNWASCTTSSTSKKPVLDQTMAVATPPGIQVGPLYLLGNPANPSVAPDCTRAVRLLNKSTIDTAKKMASDPLYNLAAQLVAAELNFAAGAYKCGPVITAIASANALLTKYSFNGKGSYTAVMTPADKTLANSLAQTLDDYNNNRPSACT